MINFIIFVITFLGGWIPYNYLEKIYKRIKNKKKEHDFLYQQYKIPPGFIPWKNGLYGLDDSPYLYDSVLVFRPEWNEEIIVNPKFLHSEFNVYGLWWKKIEKFYFLEIGLSIN